MATLVAKVAIMLKGATGDLRPSVEGGVVHYWRNAVVVERGETFTEDDPREIGRLVALGAASIR